MTDLGVLAGAAHSVAYDINEAGVIVGASGIRPVRWVPAAGGGYGAAQDLGSLGGCCGDAQAVNDGGQITGSSTHLIANPSPTPPDTAWHAYLWQNGSMSDIHPPTLFSESDQTFPWAINNAGTVVGQQFEPSRGFYRHSDGSAQLLAGLGGAGSVPIDINNAGTIVGWSQATPNDQQPWHATLWSNGVPQDLGTLGGTSSVAIAISDGLTPRVVGRADTGRGQHAFVWIQGQGMKDLGLPKGGSFGQAWDINGSGWIVGEVNGRSGQSRATLWKLAVP
jgi:probable HAF family extracellular repeat protein